MFVKEPFEHINQQLKMLLKQRARSTLAFITGVNVFVLCVLFLPVMLSFSVFVLCVIPQAVLFRYISVFIPFAIFRPIMFRFVSIVALYAISFFVWLSAVVAQLARFSLDVINNESQ